MISRSSSVVSLLPVSESSPVVDENKIENDGLMRGARRVDSTRERKKLHQTEEVETETEMTMTSIQSPTGSASMPPATPNRSTTGSIVQLLMVPFSMLNSVKFLVLVVLSLQNSLFTVLRRYSQGVLKEQYSTYEVLMVGEIIKMAVSAYMIHRHMKEIALKAAADAARTAIGGTPPQSTVSHASEDEFLNPSSSSQSDRKAQPIQHTSEHLIQRLRFLLRHSGKMVGLALIYGAMNILSFVALRNIGAGLFTIFAQCKILTTALFSALILQRKYSGTQWRALLTLFLGVLLFSEAVWGDSKNLYNAKNKDANVGLGIAAVVTEVTLSGFASIYFEKVIKTDPMQLSIWERNFQLALGSVPVYLAFMAWTRGGTAGYFGGWSIVAWTVALLGAAGGLLVALSIKYGDSILKTLATTAAIILSSVLDWWLMDGIMTPIMLIAGTQVVLSICNYTFDPTPPDYGASEDKKELPKQSDRPVRKHIEQVDDNDEDNYNEGIPLIDQHRRNEP